MMVAVRTEIVVMMKNAISQCRSVLFDCVKEVVDTMRMTAWRWLVWTSKPVRSPTGRVHSMGKTVDHDFLNIMPVKD